VVARAASSLCAMSAPAASAALCTRAAVPGLAETRVCGDAVAAVCEGFTLVAPAGAAAEPPAAGDGLAGGITGEPGLAPAAAGKAGPPGCAAAAGFGAVPAAAAVAPAEVAAAPAASAGKGRDVAGLELLLEESFAGESAKSVVADIAFALSRRTKLHSWSKRHDPGEKLYPEMFVFSLL
jgi:hypothetical protein